MSARWSTVPGVSSCSGAMYIGVPSTLPVPVNRSDSPGSLSIARPKSVSRARPSRSMSTFSGLRSRWTTPRVWAYCSAADSSPAILKAVLLDTPPAISPRRLWPSTYSITR